MGGASVARSRSLKLCMMGWAFPRLPQYEFVKEFLITTLYFKEVKRLAKSVLKLLSDQQILQLNEASFKILREHMVFAALRAPLTSRAFMKRQLTVCCQLWQELTGFRGLAIWQASW
jgi:hypothetical protein